MINRAAFYHNIRNTLLFVIHQGMVDGIENIFNYWEGAYKDLPIEYLAYILATTYHETAHTFAPIEEYGGNERSYAPYYGRGYVQLTWHTNYRLWGQLLGIDLVSHPELALVPKYAVEILVRGMIEGRFTGHKLHDYYVVSVPAYGNMFDAYNARKIVNGLDKAGLIKHYSDNFLDALKQAETQ